MVSEFYSNIFFVLAEFVFFICFSSISIQFLYNIPLEFLIIMKDFNFVLLMICLLLDDHEACFFARHVFNIQNS